VIDAVDALEPEGETALTDAVQMAAEVLDYRQHPATVVLVTDGRETCGGAPCQLATRLVNEAENLTVHVIGFKVRGDFFSWEGQGAIDYEQAISPARCLAEDTGGTYVRAETLDDLIAALRVTLGCNVLF
jgi:Ca-activated chloride channel family protein